MMHEGSSNTWCLSIAPLFKVRTLREKKVRILFLLSDSNPLLYELNFVGTLKINDTSFYWAVNAFTLADELWLAHSSD